MTRDEIVEVLSDLIEETEEWDDSEETENILAVYTAAITILNACPVDDNGNVVMTDGVVGYGTGSGPREVGS